MGAAPVAPATHVTRPAIVPASLECLHGPASGTIVLPRRLSWSREDNEFDLADRADLLDAYPAVLGAARSMAEITGFLDASLLRETWPDLSISRAIRRGWEDAYPELRERRLPQRPRT